MRLGDPPANPVKRDHTETVIGIKLVKTDNRLDWTTYARAPYALGAGPHFSLRREEGWDRFLKRAGLLEEHSIDDASFNAAYVITGAPSAVVRRVINGATRRALLNELSRPSVSADGEQVVLRVSSMVREPKTLMAMFSAVHAIATAEYELLAAFGELPDATFRRPSREVRFARGSASGTLQLRRSGCVLALDATDDSPKFCIVQGMVESDDASLEARLEPSTRAAMEQIGAAVITGSSDGIECDWGEAVPTEDQVAAAWRVSSTLARMASREGPFRAPGH